MDLPADHAFRLDDLLCDAVQVLADHGYSSLAESVRIARARLEGKPDPPLHAIRAVAADDAVIPSSSHFESIMLLGAKAALGLHRFDHTSGPILAPESRTLVRTLRAQVDELPPQSACAAAPALVRHLTKTIEGLVASTDLTMIGHFPPAEAVHPTSLGVARALPDPAGAYVAHVVALHRTAQTARTLLGRGV